jgi:type 1 fimbriae regulatory protein FimB/type 1 fimbriae regulatory protein FimE
LTLLASRAAVRFLHGTEILFSNIFRCHRRPGVKTTQASRGKPHKLTGQGTMMGSMFGHDTWAMQAWMGHKNIQHTVRYTELAPDRFRDFWRD